MSTAAARKIDLAFLLLQTKQKAIEAREFGFPK
jgi:hypothetical protein